MTLFRVGYNNKNIMTLYKNEYLLISHILANHSIKLHYILQFFIANIKIDDI